MALLMTQLFYKVNLHERVNLLERVAAIKMDNDAMGHPAIAG